MAIFTDYYGSHWRIALSGRSVRAVREQTGFDPLAGNIYEFTLAFPDVLNAMLAAVCARQLRDRNLSPAQFFMLISISRAAAHQAFFAAVLDCLPDDQRQVMAAAAEHSKCRGAT